MQMSKSNSANPAPRASHEAEAAQHALQDERLIAMSCMGDERAFDTLIGRYERPIYRLAYRLSGNHDDAQEIAAETFLRICRNLSGIRSAITLRAWINRIVAN